MSHLAALRSEPSLHGQGLPYVCARLAQGMTIFALLLHAHARLGTYSRAGVIVAVYSTAVAVVAPLLGRVADRIGSRRVLTISAVGYGLGAALLLAAHGMPQLLAGALLAGVFLPPTSASLRSSWRVLPSDLRTWVFRIDSVIAETSNVIGPLIVAAALSITSPSAPLAIAALAIVLGGLGAARALGRAVEARPEAPIVTGWRRLLGPLHSAEVNALLAVVAAGTASIGILEVVAASFASSHHHASWSGLLLAALSVGGVLGGLAYSALPIRASLRTQMLALCLVTAAGFLLLNVETGPITLGLLLAIGSMATTPLLGTLLTMVSDAAPRGMSTETFTWAVSANFAAIGVGAAGGAQLIHLGGLHLAFTAAAALMLLGAGVGAAVGRRRVVVPVEMAAPIS